MAPSDFLQVVGFGAGGYCHHNAAFQWTNAAGVLACEKFIGCLCTNPSPGPEVLCNANNDDCDPTTPEQVRATQWPCDAATGCANTPIEDCLEAT